MINHAICSSFNEVSKSRIEYCICVNWGDDMNYNKEKRERERERKREREREL